MRELAAEWRARNCFFMGAFDRETGTFVAQAYVGPVNRDLPEFEIGFFVDKGTRVRDTSQKPLKQRWALPSST